MIVRTLFAICLLAASPSWAEDTCPADRPIKVRTASPVQHCTLLACAPKLVCPTEPVGRAMLDGADCYYASSGDCNTCKRDLTVQCLSQEELDRAQR